MYLTQSLHRAVQQHADRPAIRAGALVRTYGEFIERVARLAGVLQQLGMKPGDRVAMLSLNSEAFLEYQFAVPWGGGVMNPCNIRWSPAEILYSLEDSGSSILLVDDAFKPMAEGLRAKSTTLREVLFCGAGEAPAGMRHYASLMAAAKPVPDTCRRGDDLAGVFYTGGTTGFPKGVMLSHRNLVVSGLSVHSNGVTDPDGCYLHAAPMFHLADYGFSMGQWIEGCTHSLVPAFQPEAVLNAIERDRVTHVLLVPTMIQMLLDHPAMQHKRDLSSLRMVIYGASPISEAVLDRAMAALPGVAFAQAYGMTELAPVATYSPPHLHTPEGRKLGKLRSAGRASYCVEVKVAAPDGAEVARGTVGEVLVRGPNVMQGYWNKPELTAAAVRDGWMHTGDAGYMDADGYLFLVDRLKDMIISGGENVFSAEVENAVARHAAVAACAVIGVPSEQWGEAVHAVVVLKPGSQASEAELIAHCKTLLAGYKCPRTVAFVDALPLSGAGKVLKTKLREPHWIGRQRGIA